MEKTLRFLTLMLLLLIAQLRRVQLPQNILQEKIVKLSECWEWVGRRYCIFAI